MNRTAPKGSIIRAQSSESLFQPVKSSPAFGACQASVPSRIERTIAPSDYKSANALANSIGATTVPFTHQSRMPCSVSQAPG